MQSLKGLRRFVGTAIAAVLFSGLLLLGAPKAKADGFDDCNRRVAFTEYRLHQAVERFGYYSPQANHWRHERSEAYERLERYRSRHQREWRERHDRDRY
jgi:hypothetical protein